MEVSACVDVGLTPRDEACLLAGHGSVNGQSILWPVYMPVLEELLLVLQIVRTAIGRESSEIIVVVYSWSAIFASALPKSLK
jgi:hypothetical protein